MATGPDWDDAIWAQINDAVQKEIAKIRVLQKVIPTQVLNDDPTEVQNDVVAIPKLTIEEGNTKPFIEIYREFSATSSQVRLEGQKWTCKTLARMAAKEIGLAEDAIFFQGSDWDPPAEIHAEQRGSAGTGLLGEALEEISVEPVPKDDDRPGLIWGENTFAAVTLAITKLIEKGQAPSYALILPTAVYADTFVPPSPASLVTTAERIRPQVEGGFYGTGTLPGNKGLVAALGGEPTSLYVAREAMTEFVQQKGAEYIFRVVERVQFVARDPRAFVSLIFDERKDE